MPKKPGISTIDFHFGFGRIIPSTKEAYKRESAGISPIPERGQLVDFKSTFGGNIDTQLIGNGQFPSPHEFFIFVMQYFVGESEYRSRDIDNMAKTILDVLKGRFYHDDGQVKTLLVGKKVDLYRIPQNFGYVAVKELRSDSDVEALKISGVERCVTYYQELKSHGFL